MAKKLLAVLLSLLMLTSCSLMSGYQNNIDESKLDFDSQLSAPDKNEEIAVITTSLGVIKIKFFKDHAPNACENFITLARQGYYDNTYVFCVEPNVAFMAGTSDREGQTATTVFEENKPFDNEYTDALWHFSGAVSSLSNVRGKSDSRFFITATAKVSDEMLSSMQRVGYPQSLIDKYKLIGGVPGLDKNHTVFAQMFEGEDVVSKIMQSKTDENAIPTPDVKIIKIEITNYNGE